MSEDFPLFHSSLIPIHNTEKRPIGKRIIPSNIYTNEHPDFFKLDYMKEKGYRNPYLDEVIKVDRSEQFKKIESNADRIALINYMKNNRKLSQDPKKLKFIQSEFDLEMHKKRQRKKEEKNNKKEDSKMYLSSEPKDSNYLELVKQLNDFSPRMTFHTRRYIDTKDNITLGKFNISRENFNKIKKIKSEIEPQKSSYLCNCNDYKISEAQNRDKNREFYHKRRDFIKTSLINGFKEKICLPPERNERWGNFYENYLLMANLNNGFRRKGGLFTEFSNKNMGSIMVNKRDIIEKIRKEKEKKMNKTAENSLIKNNK